MHRRKSLTGTLRRLLAASNGSVLASGSPAHRALSTCSAAIPANSDQGPSGWESWHAAGVLLGVSALAAASCTRAECESQQSAPSAQARLAELWADISEDLHRTEAGFPLAPQLAQRPQPPRLGWRNGSQAVHFPIREGVAVNQAAAALAERMASEGAVSKATATIMSFQSHSTPLRAQLTIARDQAAQVEFFLPSEPAGQIAEPDLAVISAVLRASNSLVQEEVTPFSRTRTWHGTFPPPPGAPGGGLRGMDGTFRSPLGGPEGGPKGLEDIFQHHVDSGMQDVMDLMQQHLRQLFGEGGPSEGGGSAPWPPEGSMQGWPRDGQSDQDWATDQEQPSTPAHDYGSQAANKAVQRLQSLGATVHPPVAKDAMDWGVLAGYEEQKAQIEDTLLLALKHPEVFDGIARRTRRQYASNCPRAILFEGPPGCGKTTSARVIATQAAVPLVYIPLEAIASKFYGESEKLMAQLFQAASQLQGAIVFLDELDALATSRSSEMHEATRRVLGVLLRQLDGFAQGSRTVVLAATNRKQDLDPALLSRFDASIAFQLPSASTRQQILEQYAQHLSAGELQQLASATDRCSGRDIRDLCEQAERHWAAKVVRGQAGPDELPPLDAYMNAAAQRRQEMSVAGNFSRLPKFQL